MGSRIILYKVRGLVEPLEPVPKEPLHRVWCIKNFKIYLKKPTPIYSHGPLLTAT